MEATIYRTNALSYSKFVINEVYNNQSSQTLKKGC